LTGGYRLAFWVGAGLVVAIVFAVTVLKPEPQAKAEIQALVKPADREAA
jgi:hypothetical protein